MARTYEELVNLNRARSAVAGTVAQTAATNNMLQVGQPFYDTVRQIIQPFGARVTSTSGDTHNRGSLHPLGAAMDIGVKEYTPERQAALLAALQADPRLRVLDERVHPQGQAVWSAPHFHIEIRGMRGAGGSQPAAASPPNTPAVPSPPPQDALLASILAAASRPIQRQIPPAVVIPATPGSGSIQADAPIAFSPPVEVPSGSGYQLSYVPSWLRSAAAG